MDSIRGVHSSLNVMRSSRRPVPGAPEIMDDVDAEDPLAEDPFELEMEKELERRAQHAQRIQGWTHSPNDPIPSASTSGTTGAYDPIYFDSDEENERETEFPFTPSKRKMISNDELLYDPDQDDHDQAWADGIRKQYIPEEHRHTGHSRSSKVKPLPNSDAVLNCPACFNVLCLDCQRHEVYETQYRAMFVTNCSVDTTQRLKYPKAKAGSKKKAKKTLDDETDPPEEFHPVNCDHCSTEVAMYDKDEIYHFFNVMASHS